MIVPRQYSFSYGLVDQKSSTCVSHKRGSEVRQAGVGVETRRADVTRADQVDRIVRQVREKMPPLHGIFHSTRALDDAAMRQLDSANLVAVGAAELQGAWNLHRGTLGLPLDFFVFFSSVAAVLGPEGPPGEAAGNMFLDALARHRRQIGLPATSINWGPWHSDIGAEETTRSGRATARGLTALPAEEALEAMESVLRSGRPHVAVMDVDWAKALPSETAEAPTLLRGVTDAGTGLSPGSCRSDEALLRELRQADPRRARERLVAHFKETLARVVDQDSDRIEADARIGSLGLDSLMIMELKDAIEASMDIVLPISLLLQDPSVEQIADHALEAWRAGGAEAAVAEPV